MIAVSRCGCAVMMLGDGVMSRSISVEPSSRAASLQSLDPLPHSDTKPWLPHSTCRLLSGCVQFCVFFSFVRESSLCPAARQGEEGGGRQGCCCFAKNSQQIGAFYAGVAILPKTATLAGHVLAASPRHCHFLNTRPVCAHALAAQN